jgi:hypothetical protein
VTFDTYLNEANRTLNPGNLFTLQGALFHENKKIVFPGAPFAVDHLFPASEPLFVTEPVVDETMTPDIIYTASDFGDVITHIGVTLTGDIDAATSIFIYTYSLADLRFYCIGAIAIPVVSLANQNTVDDLPLPDVVYKADLGALKLEPVEPLYCGSSLQLTNDVIINIRGQTYKSILDV